MTEQLSKQGPIRCTGDLLPAGVSRILRPPPTLAVSSGSPSHLTLHRHGNRDPEGPPSDTYYVSGFPSVHQYGAPSVAVGGGCPVQGPLPPASLCLLCLRPKGDPPALGAVPLAVSLGSLSSCVLQRPLPRRGSSSGARERRPRTRTSTCRTSTSGERLAEGLAHIIPMLLPRT